MPSASPDSAAAPGPAEHNLPTPLTSLIGRERELNEIARALRDARLITVTGPVGVGKTRVALELARRQVPRWSDGPGNAYLSPRRRRVEDRPPTRRHRARRQEPARRRIGGIAPLGQSSLMHEA